MRSVCERFIPERENDYDYAAMKQFIEEGECPFNDLCPSTVLKQFNYFDPEGDKAGCLRCVDMFRKSVEKRKMRRKG